MNKKIKRDVVYGSIISFLMLIIIGLFSLLYVNYNITKMKSTQELKIDSINNMIADSIKSINKERISRYNADRSETNKFFWTKKEADTIYFRKINNLLLWRDNELKKYKK